MMMMMMMMMMSKKKRTKKNEEVFCLFVFISILKNDVKKFFSQKVIFNE